MTPSVDLMLATVERALVAAILPGGGNASAREEASLAVLFTRWIRDVADEIDGAERASESDCVAALADVTERLGAARLGAATAEVVREARALVDEAGPETAALRRERIGRAKALLGGLLRALRADGDAPRANEVRLALYDLGRREIVRERAYGRATGLDPDSPTLPTLAGLRREEEKRRRNER